MSAPYSQRHISSATTTAVHARTAVLRAIVVNTTAAGAVTVNDALGTIAVLKSGIAERTYQFDALCTGKIEVVTAAASDLTVIYEA
jgi:hypothetical protein